MVRWDSPLFTVPWSESDVPIELIWKAITEGNVKPPNVGTQAVSDLSHNFLFSNLIRSA
jgi:protein KTI12